jgi:hypothetical protein
MSYLSVESRDRITFVPAKYPLFENVTDRKLRALMCLFLGCDVYGGMNGVGAKTLAVDIIQGSYESYKMRRPENEEVSLYSYLKKYLHSKTDGMDHDAVQAYVRALIYEPTNVAPTEEEKEDGKSYRTYVGGVMPSVLPRYLEEFAADHTEITPGPKMERCMGVDESGHLFLAADGFNKCKNCCGVICRHCHESIGAETYCLLCYAEKCIVPIPGEDRQRAGKSIIEMRQELAEENNFDGVEQLTYEELEEFYEVKDVIYSRVNEMADAVPFPLYSSNQLDDAVCWDTLLDIDFSDGGSFITDPDLQQKYLPAVLDFFGSLVRFQSKKRTDHVKDSPIYDSMPEMLIDFAEKSRIDSGFRLLARTVRHSFDSRLSPMSECSAKLIIDENGEVGIHMKSKIPASMKKNIYDSEIAATSSSLLGCKCTCQSGSHGDERIVCVHTPVRLYRLSLLLHECLAENMLCELTARVVDSVESDTQCVDDKQWLWEMNSWSEDEKNSIKANVVLLMEAAGEFISQEDAESKNVPELLEAFAVGTQKRKEWIQSTKVPPKPSQLGPVAEMNFKSTAALGKLHMRRDTKGRLPVTSTALTEADALDDVSIDDCDEEQFDSSPNTDSGPAYRKIWSLTQAAGIDVADCAFVGIRLLNLRAERQDNQFSLLQKKAIDDASSKEWLSLVQESKNRSVNSSKSQRKNLSKRKRTDEDLPITPNPNKRQQTKSNARVVTPLPPDETIANRTRLRRHNMMLPIASKPKLAKKRPRYIKCHMPE